MSKEEWAREKQRMKAEKSLRSARKKSMSGKSSKNDDKKTKKHQNGVPYGLDELENSVEDGE